MYRSLSKYSAPAANPAGVRRTVLRLLRVPTGTRRRCALPAETPAEFSLSSGILRQAPRSETRTRGIMIERKTKRIAIIIVGALVVWVWLIAAAAASDLPSDVRRIDTENVVKNTDIHEQGTENQHETEDSLKDEADSENGQSEESESHGEETESHGAESESDGEHAEEGHHPAWMIPGWQSIFTLLAVGYFALGVTFLPKIIAKEEHN